MAQKQLEVKSKSSEQMMTVEELMAFLRVKRATVYSWVQRRQIPFHKLGRNELGHGGKRERDSRPIRFKPEEIQEWTRTGELPQWFINQKS